MREGSSLGGHRPNLFATLSNLDQSFVARVPIGPRALIMGRRWHRDAGRQGLPLPVRAAATQGVPLRAARV